MRRVLAAAVVVAAATIAPANATCVNNVCTPPAPASLPGSIDVDPGGDIWNSCLYIKYYAPAPNDWDPNADSGGPYVFTRTKAWGNQPGYGPYGTGWDTRYCNDLNSVVGLTRYS